MGGAMTRLIARVKIALVLMLVGVCAGGWVARAPMARLAAMSAQDSTANRADKLAEVHAVKITILSTMLADAGIGEWGFSALVEADGNRILFDTGARPNTVLDNARELKIDLGNVGEVVLSHYHADHVGGLLTLRRELSKTNPAAISRVHVGKGIFLSRRPPDSTAEANPMIAIRREYEATGGVFVEHDKPAEILPGVWLTGPVPRTYPERNWSGNLQIETATGWQEDTLPEDQSLVINTPRGLVFLTGCGHAGIVNSLEYAQKQVRQAPVYAALGGFHLFAASDAQLDWTADKMKQIQVDQIVGAHCTGIETVYQLREKLGLTRHTCVVGAVGAVFDLNDGIHPGRLAQ
jgi:7,8-dihydropterin-6-yl-methyl-4-(beta-D-ribofuranosyl)aminobenzene 5'-phosphate synthase